jgi:hypothetical protein
MLEKPIEFNGALRAGLEKFELIEKTRALSPSFASTEKRL